LRGTLSLLRWRRRIDAWSMARPSTINRQHLVDTLRSIGDGVIATDLRGRVTMMNASASRLTAWTERDAMAHAIDTVLRIVDERTRAVCRFATETVLAECSSVALPEFSVLVARDGRDIPISGAVAPIRRRGDGTIAGLVFSFRDVTEARCTERVRNALLERERSARREAEAMSHSKDDFVAVISHELRTPLSAIYGWTRLLQRGTLDAAAHARALDVIERNTRLQTQLIDDLLDMSRAIRGSLRLDIRVVDVATVLHAAVEAMRPASQGKQLQLEVDLASGVVICGDSARLQQAFGNLLGNAVKFTPHGGSIAIELRHHGPHAVVRLRDSGVGIPADVLPRIFDPFEQGREVPRALGGLGIGLALVRHLIGLHRGTISAASAGAGHGTTFTIHLPALAPLEDAAGLEERSAAVPARDTTIAP
jgi:PAS domain S-box-containing protein